MKEQEELKSKQKLLKSIHLNSTVKTFCVKKERKCFLFSSKHICGYSILFWLWKSFENKIACLCLFSICEMSAVSVKCSLNFIISANRERTALLEGILNLSCFQSMGSCFSARIYLIVGWWHKHITTSVPCILHCLHTHINIHTHPYMPTHTHTYHPPPTLHH